MVRTARTLTHYTVLYGGSCSGARGSWFFNAVEGGGNNELRPSYALHWAFGQSSTFAKPSGRIAVDAPPPVQITITVIDGVVRIDGIGSSGAHVVATGTLSVELDGSSPAQSLRFTETGLRDAESQLQLPSPFDFDGRPLVVPVRTVPTLSGC